MRILAPNAPNEKFDITNNKCKVKILNLYIYGIQNIGN